jgi:hypothetical protein
MVTVYKMYGGYVVIVVPIMRKIVCKQIDMVSNPWV